MTETRLRAQLSSRFLLHRWGRPQMMYVRYPLSLRNVEDLLHDREAALKR